MITFTRQNNISLCKDCEAIPSECLITQHNLLVMDVNIRNLKKKKRKVRDFKVKRCNLTTENVTKLYEKAKIEGHWKLEEDADTI